MNSNFLEATIKQFEYYRMLGQKTIDQIPNQQIHHQPDLESNSLAIMVKHLWGNMLSRWTDFLTSDGEKEWRQRDAEFDNDIKDAAELQAKYNEGWDCLFNALHGLTPAHMEQVVYIRNQGHTVAEAILRQLAHYAYHIGQIVYLGKQLVGQEWQSLSIPKGQSSHYNAKKFDQQKQRGHFTDEFLKDDE